jgi:hypothetical protein
MGTNYYVWTNTRDEMHIGKSSMGWVFALRVYPELGINNLYDWLPILLNPENKIRNEYSREVSSQEMLETIVLRSRDDSVRWSESEWIANDAVPGPNNLVRHRQMTEYGRMCTHGEGTWDYMNYEFF